MATTIDFHISATGRSLNYLPQYIAEELGFFEEVGLHVTNEVPDPWTKVLEDIDAGRASAALGGIWVPTMFHGRARDYRAFCQLSARCPHVLISRRPTSAFDWHALEGRLVVLPGSGGSGSYVFLSGLVRRAGLDVGRIRFIRDLDFGILLDLFTGGLGDYMVVDVPTSRHLAASGRAHVALDLSSAGPVPWSVYYAPAEMIERDPDRFVRFSAAIQRALDWLHANPISDIAAAVNRLWPADDTGQVLGWLEGFKASGMWNRTFEVEPGAFAVWQEMLATAGLVERPLAYREIVSHPIGGKPDGGSPRV